VVYLPHHSHCGPRVYFLLNLVYNIINKIFKFIKYYINTIKKEAQGMGTQGCTAGTEDRLVLGTKPLSPGVRQLVKEITIQSRKVEQERFRETDVQRLHKLFKIEGGEQNGRIG
jgi:hypothetical protein